MLASLAFTAMPSERAHAQACPPYCLTPVITPAWHLHMCDMSYQEQLADNHCMRGKGVTEFPAGTDRVYIIYCHKYSDTVGIQVKDSGGGLQFVNHPDGITYVGNGCESLVFAHRNGIPAGGSPYFTSAFWPEGPFSGVGAGIEWYIGLFVAFDQDNYYGNNAAGEITARDPAASADPFQIETIVVHVTSTSDPQGIDIVLTEDATGASIFKTTRSLRFSQVKSDAATNTIKVANRDVVTVTYCPRNCQTPYIDTATWYQIEATITPTPLPTWAGPAPTVTPTPPPGQRVEYVTLRPAPADVGYVPQISTNKDRPNHLGYPGIYSGMWTRGTNAHYGMVQFSLASIPGGASISDARLEMIGRDKLLTKPGNWAVQLLAASIDDGWRDATVDMVRTTAALAKIGPTLADTDLGVGRRNTFGFTPDQVALVQNRLNSTKKISFRVDGPGGEDQNLYAWQSGVDVFNRESKPPDPALGPALFLTYRNGSSVVPSPTPGNPPGATATSTLSAPGTPAAPTPTTRPGSATNTPIVPLPVTFTPTATPTARNGSATATGSAGATQTPRPLTTATGTPSPSATLSPSPSATPTATAAVGSPGPTATGGARSPTPTPAPSSGTPADPATARQVCMLAFDDRDGDGVRGPAERLLPGVPVKLTHLRTGVPSNWITDGANIPDYCWNGLPDGEYTLAVSRLPSGYVPTGPTEYRISVPIVNPVPQYEFAAQHAEIVPPTPPPSNTPPPTPTVLASPTPSPEPTIAGPSGQICIAVFDDPNRNGLHEPTERYLRNVRLTVFDDHAVVVRDLRSKDDGPLCTHLATGVYYVRAELAPNTVWTTFQQQAVLLTQDAKPLVEFGQYRRVLYLPAVLLRKAWRGRGLK